MKLIRCLNISDIHLGNRRLDAAIMTAALWAYIVPFFTKKKINLFSVQGDLFDTAVSYADPSSPAIAKFLVALLKLGNDHGVTMRFMRGTFSHDRNQIINVPALHEAMGCTNDLMYFDTISLEYIEHLDMKILYLPDNLPYESSDAVMKVVHEKMREMGWDTVDYAYVHGYFAFALPDAARDVRIVYRDEQFDFVKRYVNVGHDHGHAISPSGNIVYNGSLDRLGHGEEGPKGGVYIVDDGTKATLEFVENPNATIFKTYDYSEYDSLENIMGLFAKELAILPGDRPVYVRIIHPKSEVRVALGTALKDSYPLVRYTHSKGSTQEKEVASVNDIAMPKLEHGAEMITEENLPTLVHQFLADKKNLSMGISEIEGLLEKLAES